jgi:hypothetical protein
MNFFDNEGKEVFVHTGDFVAFYFKPNEYLAVAIQTIDKKMLNIIENSKKEEYFLFESSITSFEQAKKEIERKIGFKLEVLEGAEKKHKENNLAQLAYSSIPSQNRNKKNVITVVFKIGNPI